jgi:4a-hydroxytetrahydrobiopterin dehydratase
VKLKTHSAGGITDKDFLVAKKIEELALWRPPQDSPLKGGSPNKFVRSN